MANLSPADPSTASESASGDRFSKVLVANRGEIACRILRTLKDMGLESVAIYSDADREARWVVEADQAVHIGAGPSSESYLDFDAVLRAARLTGAEAVHPGYGFLSENADFVEACQEAGLIFVGPSAEAVRAMGLKREAKALARDAGLPVLDGFAVETQGHGFVESVFEQADALGFPLLIKASAGGGGRGMRVAEDAAGLGEALASARREARAAFGNPDLIVERYLPGPRHVEIQILADAHGQVLHAFERDCSVQRRHQKVIEEAPCPVLSPELRQEMGEAAVKLAQAVGYRGLGTVEFLLEPSNGDFFFLEMNTRLQVEHPVTEAILGLDLVRLQLEIAQGRPLPYRQEDLRMSGHAVEVRLYAEDPSRDFLPSAGTLSLWSEPELPGLRIDSGVRQGDEVPVFYDPLLAKLVAHGADRAQALRRLRRGLQETAVGGVKTNRELLLRILDHDTFKNGVAGTSFLASCLDRTDILDTGAQPESDDLATSLIAATVLLFEDRRASSELAGMLTTGWRNVRRRPQIQELALGDERYVVAYESIAPKVWRMDVSPGPYDPAGQAWPFPTRTVSLASYDGDNLCLEVDGVRSRFQFALRRGHDEATLWVYHGGRTHEIRALPRFPRPKASEVSGGCIAPMTGKVIAVAVEAGDRVEAGQALVTLEAMKMEHSMTAAHAGRVAAVHVREGQMVHPDKILVTLEEVEG